MSKPIKVAITTGDVDGIGTEVSIKALSSIGPKRGIQFFLFRSAAGTSRSIGGLDRKYRRICTSHADFDDASLKSTQLIDVVSAESPVCWFETSVRAARRGEIDAIVTAPMSKTTIKDSGEQALGHTGIIAKHMRSKSLFMAFLGREFNVLLATGHIPLDQVGKELNTRVLKSALHAGLALKSKLGLKKPVGLVGVNPHASEQGLIGTQEGGLYKRVLKHYSAKDVIGPLVPDAAFLQENRKKYSLFVCPYHDQGLIAFKTVHGHDSGVHVTLGADFIRTSVNHGTAKDIFGKNRANPGSMIDAIQTAVQMAQAQKRQKKKTKLN